jgi:hypothetical protein|tara:strand:+ start:74 stop:361 length:288 start_codon:yes stop_codon:yes gene_type:complete
MIEVGTSGVGSVDVVTTNNAGLPVEHWAERATNTIVSVGGNSHPIIQEQAEAFKEQVFHAVKYYMDEAVKSDRTTLIAQLELNGHKDMADILRRL